MFKQAKKIEDGLIHKALDKKLMNVAY